MSEQKEETAQKMTPEEMERRKIEIGKFHKEQIPFLKQQLEYEDLLTAIEESRARRAMAFVRTAQIMAGPEPDQETKPKESAPKEATMSATRTLKKEPNADQ